MTLALDDVCDLDCVVSTSPLVLDLPAAEVYARGAAAILRRVLYAWMADLGLGDIDGASLSQSELVVLRSRLEQIAEDEDYVLSADVTVDVGADGALAIVARIKLIDGNTYALEVSAAAAVAVTFDEAA